MKTDILKLKNYGVYEMDVEEMKNIQGGAFRIAIFNFSIWSYDRTRNGGYSRWFHTGW